MRWARIGAWVWIGVAAPWMAQASSLCLTNPPDQTACAAAASATGGDACTCVAGGHTRAGIVVNSPEPHYYSRGIHLPSAALPAPPQAALPPPVSPKSSAGPRPAASVARPLQPARALRLGSEIPDAGVGAYGIVALPATATADTQARLDLLCRAFLASLPPQSSLPASIALGDQMLTYWPVTARSAEQCDAMLANYDLFAGQKAIRDAAARHNDVGDRGPYLIGWSPSSSRDRPDAIVLVVDLSSLDSERSFTDAFQFWQERVVQDPSLWRNGFSMFLVRRAARDFADHYGTDILKALHLSSD